MTWGNAHRVAESAAREIFCRFAQASYGERVTRRSLHDRSLPTQANRAGA